MRDIWNPWHGCTKCSEGCRHCYMYYLDRVRGGKIDSAVVTPTDSFDYPLSRDKNGSFKLKPAELIRVCMTSDFFVEGADGMREAAWDIIYQRPDLLFFLLTKRPERVKDHLPADWGEGWDNVFFNVTCENQLRADERVPLLLELPFKHKGVMCAPLLGDIDLSRYLADGRIEQVMVGGENYDGARPCHYEWVKHIHDDCVQNDVTFAFIETGNVYVKGGVTRRIDSKREQAFVAYGEGLSYRGKGIDFVPKDRLGLEIPLSERYVPHYREHCLTCGGRLTCDGCQDCGKCGERIVSKEEADAFDQTNAPKAD